MLSFVSGLGLVLSGRPAPAQAPADWGTVKGQIVWAGGDIPQPKEIAVDKDKEHCLGKGPIRSEDWVVNAKNKGIRWAFVWLAPDPPDPKKKLPIHPDRQNIKDKEVAIDQPNCAFIPHALVLREGQTLVAKNSAPVVHNVNWTGGLKNAGGNVILPANGSHKIEGLKADRFPVLVACNIHPWMKAYVRVFDHPYYAVTDENGNFEIKLAPAGDYRLVVWHEAVGWRGGAPGRDGQKITIKGNAKGDAVTDVGKLDLKP